MNMIWTDNVQDMELRGVQGMKSTIATMIACGIVGLLSLPSASRAADPTNTNLGEGSLASVTSGNLNTALGYSALFSDTSGYDNTATGASSLRDNTTGFANTATGG